VRKLQSSPYILLEGVSGAAGNLRFARRAFDSRSDAAGISPPGAITNDKHTN
jgi:hypothetical protein